MASRPLKSVALSSQGTTRPPQSLADLSWLKQATVDPRTHTIAPESLWSNRASVQYWLDQDWSGDARASANMFLQEAKGVFDFGDAEERATASRHCAEYGNGTWENTLAVKKYQEFDRVVSLELGLDPHQSEVFPQFLTTVGAGDPPMEQNGTEGGVMPASVVDDGSLYIRAVNRVMFEPRDVQWMSLVDLNGCITRFTDAVSNWQKRTGRHAPTAVDRP